MAVLTVSQINNFLKNTLSTIPQLKNLYINGEISNFKRHYQSGHIYFTLKDSKSQLPCVMFRSYASQLSFNPESGMKVLCNGNVEVYEAGGYYQLYVHDIQPQGVGALQLAFEQLKAKLSQKGIFDEAHKKPIPQFPRKIGVATSNTGAAVEDIKNILNRRYPLCDVVIVPTVVQGVNAPADIVRSIHLLDSMGDIDTIIVGRGGGSLEDLSAFNSEAVAMAVYHCKTPIISAVGHETDYTICDFASDRRAPTPSAAAEIAVPDVRDLKSRLADSRLHLAQLMHIRLQNEEKRVMMYKEASPLADYGQFIDGIAASLDGRSAQMQSAFRALLMKKEHSLRQSAAALNALSPLAVLSRGYSIAQRDGNVISDAAQVTPGDSIRVTLSKGSLTATVNEVNSNEN